MNKNLLGLASILAASSLLLGGCASGNPGEGGSSILDEATSSTIEDEKSDSSLSEENKDDSRLIEIVKGIANNLFGSSVEGEDWIYDADYDVYLTGAVIPGVTPDEAILVAESFLIEGYTLDTEPFYSEEYGDYETYFSYDGGTIYVDAFACVDPDNESDCDLEYYVYLAEAPGGDESIDSGEQNVPESEVVDIIKAIATNLYGTCVQGEDWFYFEDYDVYAIGALFSGYTPAEVIESAEYFLPEGYAVLVEPYFDEEYQDYEAAYSYADGSIIVEACAYVDEEDPSYTDLEYWAYYAK